MISAVGLCSSQARPCQARPGQAGSGIGAGSQPRGDCAASVSAVAEGFCCSLDQHAPFAAPARMEPVLKSASGAGTADIDAEALAADPGRKKTRRVFPAAAALFASAHGPVSAGGASRAVREEADPVAPATGRAHRQPNTVDVRVLRGDFVGCCGRCCGPGNALKAQPTRYRGTASPCNGRLRRRLFPGALAVTFVSAGSARLLTGSR